MALGNSNLAWRLRIPALAGKIQRLHRHDSCYHWEDGASKSWHWSRKMPSWLPTCLPKQLVCTTDIRVGPAIGFYPTATAAGQILKTPCIEEMQKIVKKTQSVRKSLRINLQRTTLTEIASEEHSEDEGGFWLSTVEMNTWITCRGPHVPINRPYQIFHQHSL